MRKFLISIATTASVLAIASPASAQYYGGGYGSNNGYGYNNGTVTTTVPVTMKATATTIVIEAATTAATSLPPTASAWRASNIRFARSKRRAGLVLARPTALSGGPPSSGASLTRSAATE